MVVGAVNSRSAESTVLDRGQRRPGRSCALKINFVLILVVALALVLPSLAQAQQFFGTRIFLQNTHGGYVSALYDGGTDVLGNSPNRDHWERIEVLDLNGGQLLHGDIVALR